MVVEVHQHATAWASCAQGSGQAFFSLLTGDVPQAHEKAKPALSLSLGQGCRVCTWIHICTETVSAKSKILVSPDRVSTRRASVVQREGAAVSNSFCRGSFFSGYVLQEGRAQGKRRECVGRMNTKKLPHGLAKVSAFFIYWRGTNSTRCASPSELFKISLSFFYFLDPCFTYCLPILLFSGKILLEAYQLPRN